MRYQHYSKRRAPWIKAYTDILDPLEHPAFTKLTDGAKLTLHHLRLLAGVTGNQIPETWITSGHLNMQTKPRVTELSDAGFVEWVDAGALASADADTSQRSDGSLAASDSRAPSRATRAPHRTRSQSNKDLDLASLTQEDQKNQKQHRACARELVENFTVTERLREWAAKSVPGVDIDAATDSWRDHFRNNNYRTRAGPVCDADAAWRNWMRNEVKFNRGIYGSGNGMGSESTSNTRKRVPVSYSKDT